MKYNKEQLEEIFNNTFVGLVMLVRDTNLYPEIENKYIPNMILREKGFVDASSRIGGMPTTHRFCILSNHMYDISSFGKVTNCGHCIAKSDSHFKVLDKIKLNGKTIIILLHLPYDETWKAFINTKINIEDEMVKKTIEIAKRKFGQEPIPELATEDWLNRCKFPIGMTVDGKIFELE